MICNHYVLITNSESNGESPTIISVEFTDWLIPNMEIFCFEGGVVYPPSRILFLLWLWMVPF